MLSKAVQFIQKTHVSPSLCFLCLHAVITFALWMKIEECPTIDKLTCFSRWWQCIEQHLKLTAAKGFVLTMFTTIIFRYPPSKTRCFFRQQFRLIESKGRRSIMGWSHIMSANLGVSRHSQYLKVP